MGSGCQGHVRRSKDILTPISSAGKSPLGVSACPWVDWNMPPMPRITNPTVQRIVSGKQASFPPPSPSQCLLWPSRDWPCAHKLITKKIDNTSTGNKFACTRRDTVKSFPLPEPQPPAPWRQLMFLVSYLSFGYCHCGVCVKYIDTPFSQLLKR